MCENVCYFYIDFLEKKLKTQIDFFLFPISVFHIKYANVYVVICVLEHNEFLHITTCKSPNTTTKRMKCKDFQPKCYVWEPSREQLKLQETHRKMVIKAMCHSSIRSHFLWHFLCGIKIEQTYVNVLFEYWCFTLLFCDSDYGWSLSFRFFCFCCGCRNNSGGHRQDCVSFCVFSDSRSFIRFYLSPQFNTFYASVAAATTVMCIRSFFNCFASSSLSPKNFHHCVLFADWTPFYYANMWWRWRCDRLLAWFSKCWFNKTKELVIVADWTQRTYIYIYFPSCHSLVCQWDWFI